MRVRVTSVWRSRLPLVYSTNGHVRPYKLKRWEDALRDINDQLSTCSLRTSDSGLCSAYRRVYFQNYNRMWAVRFQKKQARERFHVFSTKRSLLDGFFMSFVKHDRRQPVILYGASIGPSHGRGELSVPVKKVFAACKRFFPTIKVNEHLTTKCHSICGAITHPLKNRGETKKTHGVLYCPSCKLFVNRDRDASKSIRKIGLSTERPHEYALDRRYAVMQPLQVLPVKQIRSE